MVGKPEPSAAKTESPESPAAAVYLAAPVATPVAAPAKARDIVGAAEGCDTGLIRRAPWRLSAADCARAFESAGATNATLALAIAHAEHAARKRDCCRGLGAARARAGFRPPPRLTCSIARADLKTGTTRTRGRPLPAVPRARSTRIAPTRARTPCTLGRPTAPPDSIAPARADVATAAADQDDGGGRGTQARRSPRSLRDGANRATAVPSPARRPHCHRRSGAAADSRRATARHTTASPFTPPSLAPPVLTPPLPPGCATATGRARAACAAPRRPARATVAAEPASPREAAVAARAVIGGDMEGAAAQLTMYFERLAPFCCTTDSEVSALTTSMTPTCPVVASAPHDPARTRRDRRARAPST